MKLITSLMDVAAPRWFWLTFVLTVANWHGIAFAAPYVEFDFARTAECRDVTPGDRSTTYPQQRVVEMTLPVSVRFRGVPLDDVDELDVEISGAASAMRVHAFSPTTQLTSDVDRSIETTTTTKKDRSLDATLGGTIPVPAANIVAHVSPSITAAAANCDTTTEKMNRLPPKQATVVSGTSSEGRGVFFKIKPSTQTSLEGVHELKVAFVVPSNWKGGAVQVGCSARGQRKTLFIKQPATLGRAVGNVQLYLVGDVAARSTAQRQASVVEKENENLPQFSLMGSAAAELVNFIEVVKSTADDTSAKGKIDAMGL